MDLIQLLRARLRREPSKYSVPGSLPVLFFGDLSRARVATIGLNPSDREYTDRDDRPLIGTERRLATLDWVGARDRSALTDAMCDEAMRWMESYFARSTVYDRYFRTLLRFLDGFGASLADGTAVHLDLVQEATKPRWSDLARLDPAEHRALLAADLPFLMAQLATIPAEAVICTGATVSQAVLSRLPVAINASGQLGSEQWWSGKADIGGRTVAIAGWNIPLHRATGLDSAGLRDFGMVVRDAAHSATSER